jgi:hypothetical protein
MNRGNYDLREKMNKFGVLSAYIQESIGPEARKKGLRCTKNQLRQSVFLFVVEGKTDKKFYNAIFNKSNSVTIDLTCGESNSDQERKSLNLFGKSAVQRLFEKNHHIRDPLSPVTIRVQSNRALGLIDLDYDNYPTSNNISYPNLYKPQQYLHLFTTETNDLETLLLQYGIFDKLLSEIFRNRKTNLTISFDDFRNYVYLRIKLINHTFRLATKIFNLSWKHVKLLNLDEFCFFINQPDEALCESFTALVFHRDSKNNNNLKMKENFVKDLTSDFTNLATLKDQNLSFCQGHNTMMVVQCMYLFFLQQRLTERRLFAAVTDDCLKNNRFQKTQLYKSLRNWEDLYFPFKPARMFDV